jgi:hypothetical protein
VPLLEQAKNDSSLLTKFHHSTKNSSRKNEQKNLIEPALEDAFDSSSIFSVDITAT